MLFRKCVYKSYIYLVYIIIIINKYILDIYI